MKLEGAEDEDHTPPIFDQNLCLAFIVSIEWTLDNQFHLSIMLGETLAFFLPSAVIGLLGLNNHMLQELGSLACQTNVLQIPLYRALWSFDSWFTEEASAILMEIWDHIAEST